jgi:hypothetical protein
MKKVFYSLLVVSMIGLTIVCCDEKGNDGNQGDGDINEVISGELISNTRCKSYTRSGEAIDETPDTISRVYYSYDIETKKLTLKHINAGFNCCPDSLYCKIELIGDTIVVKEYQKAAGCRCLCVYDLNIVVKGALMKKYQVRFVERYVDDQEKLEFGIDLAKDTIGSYSVIRKDYPWGIKSL